jgi:hypothetical protein
MRRTATLASDVQKPAVLKVTVLWILLGLSGVLLAADTELPEMDFLEYLGFWEESDEDWVLLSVEAAERIAAKDTRTEPVPEGKDSAESDDES